MAAMTQILTNQTANGNSAEFFIYDINTEGGVFHISEMFFSAQGTWDGATVTLEYSVNEGVTWIACGPDTTLTENGGGRAFLPTHAKIRATVSGAGVSTDLDAFI